MMIGKGAEAEVKGRLVSPSPVVGYGRVKEWNERGQGVFDVSLYPLSSGQKERILSATVGRVLSIAASRRLHLAMADMSESFRHWILPCCASARHGI